MPSRRIVLMGFSQGCAMALMTGLRHAERLAGIAGLSGYLPLADSYQLAGMLLIIITLTTVLARNYRQALARVIELKLRAEPVWKSASTCSS